MHRRFHRLRSKEMIIFIYIFIKLYNQYDRTGVKITILIFEKKQKKNIRFTNYSFL
jgi:hypothetical protein